MINEKYYFDANALFKFYKNEQGSEEIRRLVANAEHPILVSQLTLLECLSTAMKYRRKGIFRAKNISVISNTLRKIAANLTKEFELVLMPEETFKIAHEILLNYAKTYDIGSHDALHLAIVKKLEISSAIMVTSDNSLQKVCEQAHIHFYDPEIAPV